MAHDKVYGFCESGCKVEVDPKGTALPKSGGRMTGDVDFADSNALQWTTANGTIIRIRPYAPANVFQITMQNPKTGQSEIGVLNIDTAGNVYFSKAISVEEGGTGAADAAGARRNIGAAEVRDGIVLTDNLGGFGTGTGAGSWWKIWNINDGTDRHFPAAFMPSENGTQELGNAEYRIKKVYANEYSGGKWHGDAIGVDHGGTGAADAETARNNLGAAAKNHTHTKSQISDFPTSMPASDVHPWAKAESKPSYSAGEVGAVPSAGGNVTGWLDFGNFTHGLRWYGSNGTLFELRPYVDSEIFQLVITPPGGAGFGALTINSDGTPNFAKALPVTSGGTGATDAAGARNAIEAAHYTEGIVKVNNQGGIGTSKNPGNYWALWNLGDGAGNYPAAFHPSQNGSQQLGTSDYRIKEVWANNYPCGTWNGNTIAVEKGGTGANTKKDARKNIGMEIQCGVVNDVGTSGVTVTFPEAFSGVPVVTASGGSEVASVYVRDVTATGFRLLSGASNNDGVQWQAIYISN